LRDPATGGDVREHRRDEDQPPDLDGDVEGPRRHRSMAALS